MHNGDLHRFSLRRRVVVGLLALFVAASTAACAAAGKTVEQTGGAPSAAPARYFGPASFGKLTVTMTEQEALATGELQTGPVSTVLGRTVYSFVDGPRPDPKQMAADEKLEKAVEKAGKSTDTSAAASAEAAGLYAESAQRMLERLEAYLGAGGASFAKGELVSVAAPEGAATEAGIKRGSTLAELKAAYAGKGLTGSAKTVYELPAAGQPGWVIRFELEKDVVRYMSLGKADS
ncbi:hypothetical protein [Actinoplanes sp. NPDC049599]|uniref:hypothetical protein n=1 Tax=Actinoplanes sp. NPDC049599 TaxID=3363903 RepID=UPI0037B4559D